MDYFQKYLIIANIISFLVFTVDFQIFIRGGGGVKPKFLCNIVTIFGGALGTTIAFFLWDRTLNKINVTWRVFSVTLLIIQVVICMAIYGPYSMSIRLTMVDFIERNRGLLIYLFIINIMTFVFFAVDKWKAVRSRSRIREAILFGLSLIGGEIGGLVAMYTLRHKKSKAHFKFGMLMILLTHIIVFIYIKSAGII